MSTNRLSDYEYWKAGALRVLAGQQTFVGIPSEYQSRMKADGIDIKHPKIIWNYPDGRSVRGNGEIVSTSR